MIPELLTSTLDGLTIRKISHKDYNKIIKISMDFTKYSTEDFPFDAMSLKNVFNSLKQGEYFKCVEDDKEVIAWIAAKGGSPFPHSSIRCLSQTFYHTCVKGDKAIGAMIKAHLDLFDYATRHQYDIVCSSSFLPNKNKFYDILRLLGWHETPVGMVCQTMWHPSAKVAPTGGASGCFAVGESCTPGFHTERCREALAAFDRVNRDRVVQYALPLFID